VFFASPRNFPIFFPGNHQRHVLGRYRVPRPTTPRKSVSFSWG
jgi:hypothetical protein